MGKCMHFSALVDGVGSCRTFQEVNTPKATFQTRPEVDRGCF